jgi:hypothetical protein
MDFFPKQDVQFQGHANDNGPPNKGRRTADRRQSRLRFYLNSASTFTFFGLLWQSALQESNRGNTEKKIHPISVRPRPGSCEFRFVGNGFFPKQDVQFQGAPQ